MVTIVLNPENGLAPWDNTYHIEPAKCEQLYIEHFNWINNQKLRVRKSPKGLINPILE